MIWGISFALHEEAVMDHRSGRILNANLAEYHVPVNADVPPMDLITVHEEDPHVNALGIKGVGEIGVTGSAGAVPTPSGTRLASASAASRFESRSW